MNWVDILIIVLVVGLGFLGWRNGVIRWVLTLIGGILGVVLAGRLYKSAAYLVPVNSEGQKQIIAFAVIFLAVLVGAWIVARILKATLNVLMLGWIDNGAGAILGLAAGALAATAIISAMGVVPVTSLHQAIDNSALAGPLVKRTSIVLAFLPSEFGSVKSMLGLGG